MSFFPMVETFFFISLGISFLLIFLMVYHFKNRVDSLEQSNVALADICKAMVYEMETMKKSIRSFSEEDRVEDLNKGNSASLMMEMFRRSQFDEEQDDPSLYKKIVISDTLTPGEELNISEWTEVMENEDSEEDSEEEKKNEKDDTEKSQDKEFEIHEEDQVEFVVEKKIEEFRQEPESPSFVNDLIFVNDNEDDLISELDQVDTISTISQNKKPIKNSPYQKMSVQTLRILALNKGLSRDPSKLKKLDLIQLLIQI